MCKWLLCLAALTFTPLSFAAIPKTFSSEKPQAKPVLEKATEEALAMPLRDRIDTLNNQGPQGYRNLVKIMFDKTQPMETRWRAVTSIGRIGGIESRREIEKAMQQPEWFMRNAALVALAPIDRQAAIVWARKFLDDKALMVRAAAVETMVDLHASDAVDMLWKKLYAKENFRNQQSLFIRRRIVEALAILEKSGAESKFVALLSDKDADLHPYAIRALERMTQADVINDKAPVSVQRERWQKWWKEKAQAKAQGAKSVIR